MGVNGDKHLDKPRKTKAIPPSRYDDFTFVELRLDKAERAEFLQYISTNPEEVWDDLTLLIQAGYKLSVSYYADGDCFIASLTCKEAGDVNNGLVLTSRSDMFNEAILMNVYKTRMLCKNNTWPREKSSRDWG